MYILYFKLVNTKKYLRCTEILHLIVTLIFVNMRNENRILNNIFFHAIMTMLKLNDPKT